ncbi:MULTISPECIES: hypothetical protein [unclassified Mycobacterium]|uniref:zinc finger domain-containing protein n=1 Tax=unclassified Mycobacterium TaxID=2642494 RepID=UPI0029C96997|nr:MULTISPECIES: hypothetical protein [unclassified Mycobacterium]
MARGDGRRLASRSDPAVRDALSRTCPDCKAEPGKWCVGVAENSRTQGRVLSRIHFARCTYRKATV